MDGPIGISDLNTGNAEEIAYNAVLRLKGMYVPFAIDFLYSIMTDPEAELDTRVECARILACEATVPGA